MPNQFNAFEWLNITSMHDMLTPDVLRSAGKAGLAFVVTGLLVALSKRLINRYGAQRLNPHDLKTVESGVSYTLWCIGIVFAMRAAGVELAMFVPGGARGVVRALVAVGAASLLAPLARRSVAHLPVAHWNAQHQILVERVVTYAIWAIGGTTALSELGFNLTFVLGGAGFVAGAAAFASQQSVAQVVSGLFLVIEQPFEIGDTITLSGVTGEVLSIDWLSTKLRTADNLFVRVPNATTLNNIVTTVSHFPIRRLDIPLGVAYGEDLNRVGKVLLGVSEKNPLGLEDPKPVFMVLGFGESEVQLQLSVWVRRERLVDFRNSILHEIKTAFAAEGIEIPYPHRALLVGNRQAALKIQSFSEHATMAGAGAGDRQASGSQARAL